MWPNCAKGCSGILFCPVQNPIVLHRRLGKKDIAENLTLVVAPKKMKKKILVAPLNWGLGHAARCIPIINALLQHHFTPVIATDGAALALLTKTFPHIEAFALPSYDIHYSKRGYLLRYKLFTEAPKIIKAIKNEQKMVAEIVKSQAIAGIISDNRFGVYHALIPSVYVTHQLKVLSGSTTWLSTKLHERYMKHFNECWVPDVAGHLNLSGKMGHHTINRPPVKYIGPLSRFKKTNEATLYDVMVLLSGPEPQRSILEKKLLTEFKNFNGRVLFVRGVIEPELQTHTQDNLTIYNFMTGTLLEKSLNASKLIVARSGYTTIMDMAQLEKKVFFIPTPGQFEQQYLAHEMRQKSLAPSCHQHDFTIDKLMEVSKFKGLKTIAHQTDFKALFRLFRA